MKGKIKNLFISKYETAVLNSFSINGLKIICVFLAILSFFGRITCSDVFMKEIERTNEFIERLLDAEEMIAGSVRGLNHECPIGIARKKIIGVEKNCKIIKVDPIELAQNPYLQNIHIENWLVGNICLTTAEKYEKYKTYNYGFLKRDPKSLTTLYELCYFPEEVHYPSLGAFYPDRYEKWMGVEPGEINTFAPFIEEAKGKVLLMGCGLGYVAYMLSLKDDVEEITIVELDPNVKKMFEMYLKRQMNNKINIILGDAIQFLENEDISMYQYCSVDIWHDVTDMLPIYLKLLLLEQRHPKTKFHYWLEEDLQVSFEAVWITLLKKAVNKKLTEKKSEIFTEILKMQNIENIEDIIKFMNAPKRPFIKEWALQNPDEAYNYEGLKQSLLKLRNK